MSAPAAAQEASSEKPKWTLVIHGGAGIIERDKVTAEQEEGVRNGLNAALDAGQKVLAGGGTAMDAIEATIRVLEDDPHFNAGRGAVFTWDGRNELDSSIMDGSNRAAGAVAGVGDVRHPVTLARAVMEHSPHVMLSGKGAEEFAKEQGLEIVDPSYFATKHRREQLEKMKANDKLGWFDVDLKYGTVGAVAMDSHGHVAAATSTGGLTGKRWDRIGDSPIIGAGTYADDRACAVSATGAGEYFIREGVAHEICARVRFKGETLKKAADTVMAEVKDLGGTGGVILTGPTGEMAWSFNTPGMYRGKVSSTTDRVVSFYGDQE
ncbi:isoaspartyl peptidase/L-asparaginase family protein [Stakelama marina]|uniref:Isoaspartyl peptidase n=1 Tax=Stakelama marina TaxID=2826939 RepID=A0A8T4IKK1_9SPHN|nr:isoaspartyl peptidase/L-asparaginase [Stakelama marina]MBR0553635.1 isoaspartyl peptidase/L-asparaginase [Stakelama marina]